MPVNLQFRNFHEIAAGAAANATLSLDPTSGRLSLAAGKKEPLKSEDHQRTWTALVNAANDHYGKERVQRVWNFYRIDPETMIQKGRPLTASHIQMLEVGTTKLRIEDLRERMKGASLEQCDPATIEAEVRRLNYFTTYPLQVPAHAISGAPSSALSHFSYDPYLMDQELQVLFKDVGKLSRKAYLERLTKAIVSRELPEGMLIPAPSPDKNGRTEYYYVYKCISKGDGLVAYALKPVSQTSNLKPMIVFRPSPCHPSGLDYLETWLNNMQKYMGWLGYQTARGALGELVYDPEFCPSDTPISVCGYSLGGIHAQLLIADYYDRIGEAVFFNDPSVDSETAKMFAVKINALPYLRHPMRVRMYRTEGDISNYANEKHLFWGVNHPDVDIRLEYIIPNETLSAQEAHGWRHFDAPHPAYKKRVYTKGQDLDKQLDNTKRGDDAIWYENLRLFSSYFLYPIFYLWSRFLQALEFYLGLGILRRTPREVNSQTS